MSWSTGLFGCCSNCGNCLCSYFCPCYAMGKAAEDVGDSCCLCGALSLCLLPCIMCMERGKMRAKYNIDGSAVGDVLVSLCCPCCGLAQMLNHKDGHSMAKDDEVITVQPGVTPGVKDENVVREQPQ